MNREGYRVMVVADVKYFAAWVWDSVKTTKIFVRV
jgi:hypothetical protein